MQRRFPRAVVLLLTGVVAAALAACAPAPRLQSTGLNSTFDTALHTPFPQYLLQTRAMIAEARADLNRINREAVLEANAPFEWAPDPSRFPQTTEGKHRRGILLIHGLTDSPYMIRPLARHLRDQGFLVRSILLPGHGTVPGDLLDVRGEEWIKALDYGVESLKVAAQEVWLGGFSTGGALAVHRALRDAEIRGLILMAPAMAVKDPRILLAGLTSLFADWIGPVHDDTDYAKYQTFAINGVVQLQQVIRDNDATLGAGVRLAVPIFTALSTDDDIVDSARTLAVLRGSATSRRNVTVYYTKDRAAGRQLVLPGVVILEESRIPAENILDVSHIAVPIPPDDPHYGREGDYRGCLHYQGDATKRWRCLRDPSVPKGETTAENLDGHEVLRRLTYNPRFDRLLNALDDFLRSADTK